MKYQLFSSKISFFEFIQDEFYPPVFDVNAYKSELNVLKKDINTQTLTTYLERYPRIFDIFEQFYQLRRFDNTQYINFLFDVNILNNASENRIMNYSRKSIQHYDNGVNNKYFEEIYSKFGINDTSRLTNEEYISATKRCIPEYVKKCIKDKNIIYEHFKNSVDTRVRIARYLIEVLNADEYSSAIDFERYLKLKKIPRDSKGLHGNFGILRISKILIDAGIVDMAKVVDEKILPIKNISSINTDGLCFVREKRIEGIKKRKDKKLKVFDFVLIQRKKPIIGIETNFYSTAGTKIGINVGEYTDLLEDIKTFNSRTSSSLKFIWITDGNYWLTKGGEQLFLDLKRNYFVGDSELLNYNLFKTFLISLQKKII